VVTRSDIEDTYRVIAGHLRRTPVIDAGAGAFGRSGTGVTVLKLEQLQCSGSFKARGAFANLTLRQTGPAGVIAASGGNHGVAVAYAAHRLGIPASIFVPSVSAPAKIARIRQLGATLVVSGERYADALVASRELAERTGALQVHAYDQTETLLGQGSLALELTVQAPDLDTVLVPVGGGGLIGGIAAYYDGAVRVVGVEPDGSPTLSMARAAGRPVDAPTEGIAADALAPKRVGELVFPITQKLVDKVVLVSDEAIVEGQRQLWDTLRVLAEPAAAVGVAALLSGAYRPEASERVGVVISGANTSPSGMGAVG
jgi:threonine dehydratase